MGGGLFDCKKKEAQKHVRRPASLVMRLFWGENGVRQYERASFIYNSLFRTTAPSSNDDLTETFVQELAQNRPPLSQDDFINVDHDMNLNLKQRKVPFQDWSSSLTQLKYKTVFQWPISK